MLFGFGWSLVVFRQGLNLLHALTGLLCNDIADIALDSFEVGVSQTIRGSPN